MIRVVAVEHMFFSAANEVRHKVCVFTEAVPDKPESRHASLG